MAEPTGWTDPAAQRLVAPRGPTGGASSDCHVGGAVRVSPL
jgi:hypothetical protein